MVYIKKLNKRIFPKYIKPEPEELFSSWFCRLAINHAIKPQSFIRNYLENYPILARDIDFFTNNKLVSFFENHTPLTNREIAQLFLKSYETITYESETSDLFYNNILTLGIQHRKRKRYGLMYCSKCLEEKAFYKKLWRLQTSILCSKCKTYLNDRCPKCSSPIMFHRINISSNISVMSFRPLYLCSECNFDLRLTENLYNPTTEEFTYQEYIDQTITNGYNDLYMYSFSYIKVLTFLAQKLKSSRKNNRFRTIISHYYPEYDYIEGTRSDIQYWSLNDRRTTLPFIYRLLNNITLFRELLIEGNVSTSYLDPDNKLPYWLTKHTIF